MGNTLDQGSISIAVVDAGCLPLVRPLIVSGAIADTHSQRFAVQRDREAESRRLSALSELLVLL